ncbi:hypothetical protein [Clostridium thailandense]|uniref:hypothetical protein n=1 Tax=Clostridium thailandense TaxID=2794346 RepID=UPI00398A1668
MKLSKRKSTFISNNDLILKDKIYDKNKPMNITHNRKKPKITLVKENTVSEEKITLVEEDTIPEEKNTMVEDNTIPEDKITISETSSKKGSGCIKWIFIILVIVIGWHHFSGAHSKEEISYKKYSNSKFGFSIEYPNTFTIKTNPNNDDSKIFSSSDNTTELTVSARNNISNESVSSVYNNLLTKHKDSYHKQEGNWFIMYWMENNLIVYQKSIVGSGSIDSFIIKYPMEQKQQYDKIITHLNESFKTPTIEERH